MQGVSTAVAEGPARLYRETVAVFHTLESAQAAVEELQSCGFNRADISTLARMDVVEHALGHTFTDIREIEDEPLAERAVFVSRRSLGDAEGLLIAVGIYLGAVIGAGFAIAGGWTDEGVFLAVLILGAVGAVLGYFIARALGGRYDRWFGAQLSRGGIVLWVTVHSPEQEQRSLDIMRAAGARDVHVHELPVTATAEPGHHPDDGLSYSQRAAERRAANILRATEQRAAVVHEHSMDELSYARRAVDQSAPSRPMQDNRPYEHLTARRIVSSAAIPDPRAAPDTVAVERPVIRTIGLADLQDALAKGRDDFLETPTQLIFLGIIYPIVGLVAARAASGGDLLPLLYPLIAGLSLLGPLAALGIYELSRRREQGLPVTWVNAFDVRHSHSRFSILVVGAVLLAIFVGWLASAMAIYNAAFGDSPPASIAAYVQELVATPGGWMLIILGNAVGFLFAMLTLTLTVVSFPLLLDRKIGPLMAMQTSVRAVLQNPLPMAVWGVIVASMLLIGCIPFFIGLAVVMPVLGHATWHLYRKVVVPASSAASPEDGVTA